MIDVVIPTIRGREQSLARCLDSLDRTTDDYAVHVIDDSETCGDGWIAGIEQSSNEYLLLATDDHEYLTPGWAEKCIETVQKGMLPCPRVWLPNGVIESQGGDMDAYRHIISRPQKDWRVVDYTTVPFVSRQQIENIGMLRTQYCGDVWVSYRGRHFGWETVLRHGFDIRHWQESVGRGAGMSQTDRDAMDEATMRKELAECESSLQGV